MEHTHGPFRIQETIRDQTKEERRDDCSDRSAAIGVTNDAGKVVRRKANAECRKPASPDEKLEKHHDGEFDADG
jgi:hypothetical protein